MPSQKLIDQALEKAINCTGRSEHLQVTYSTHLSTIEAGFRNRRFPVEVMHWSSIYENQIGTFSGA